MPGVQGRARSSARVVHARRPLAGVCAHVCVCVAHRALAGYTGTAFLACSSPSRSRAHRRRRPNRRRRAQSRRSASGPTRRSSSPVRRRIACRASPRRRRAPPCAPRCIVQFGATRLAAPLCNRAGARDGAGRRGADAPTAACRRALPRRDGVPRVAAAEGEGALRCAATRCAMLCCNTVCCVATRALPHVASRWRVPPAAAAERLGPKTGARRPSHARACTLRACSAARGLRRSPLRLAGGADGARRRAPNAGDARDRRRRERRRHDPGPVCLFRSSIV